MSRSMRAVSLWQPWASLIGIGVKTIETRSWRPPHWLIGERIAIHASAKPVSARAMGFTDAWAGRAMDALGVRDFVLLPLGAVCCTAKLVDAQQVDHIAGDVAVSRNGGVLARIDRWGDFSRGRWLWFLEDVEQFDPIPAKGRQGFWRWEIPEGAKIAA